MGRLIPAGTGRREYQKLEIEVPQQPVAPVASAENLGEEKEQEAEISSTP